MSDTHYEPIHILMSKVMGDLQAIPKSRTNEAQKFKFRGVDDTMNALHPILAKHGVFFTPEVVESEYGTYTTGKGSLMRSCALRVRYHFYGPKGDCISTAAIQGEAADSGDKATSKALAMALKYMLFQTFCIPTEEGAKNDPDASVVEARVQLNPTVQSWLDAGATGSDVMAVAEETARDMNVPEPTSLEAIRPGNYTADYLKALKVNVNERLFKALEAQPTSKGDTKNEGGAGADKKSGDTPASSAPPKQEALT